MAPSNAAWSQSAISSFSAASSDNLHRTARRSASVNFGNSLKISAALMSQIYPH